MSVHRGLLNDSGLHQPFSQLASKTSSPKRVVRGPLEASQGSARSFTVFESRLLVALLMVKAKPKEYEGVILSLGRAKTSQERSSIFSFVFRHSSRFHRSGDLGAQRAVTPKWDLGARQFRRSGTSGRRQVDGSTTGSTVDKRRPGR